MRLLTLFLSLSLAAGVTTGCAHSSAHDHARKAASPMNVTSPVVKPGVEVLLENDGYLDVLRGKRVGLITNPTGVNSELVSTIDLLDQHPEIELAALFGPEHGVRGEAYAGEKVSDYVDEETGVTVHSLYGSTRRPLPEWLDGLDVLVYDIQDIGSTSYTYIYTMAYAMEAAAERGIPFVVLDRPNPCGADFIDGPVLDTEQYSTFVGLYPMAYMYGLTPGETAMLFNGEFIEADVDLTVVKMDGYRRSMDQWGTGLPFIPTSTHIPHAIHSFFYSLTGIVGEIRGGVNIGVGYTLPFETIAAPWIDRDDFVDALREKNIPGLLVRPITYSPRYAGYSGEQIQGAHFVISDYDAIRPVSAQVHIMEVLQRLYPAPIEYTDEDTGTTEMISLFDTRSAGRSLFDEVAGGDDLREAILAGKTAEEIIAGWEPKQQEFLATRAKYLIYE